ncbi:MAG: DUF1232 domain-containing protein [Acidimicrobiia bacterium]|nr:DUF1232 domain-containing protein [Acidimicrobiia bacterium]
MSWWGWIGLTAGVLIVAVTAAALTARRSRTALIELARLIPLCLALLRDIMRDPLVPRRAKIAPALVVAYLAIPFDLVPDFIPVLGYLDDALIVAWVIRHLIKATGHQRLQTHWKGDPQTLERIIRLLRIPPAPSSPTQGSA